MAGELWNDARIDELEAFVVDLSCQGSTFYETPNIDRLAGEGISFTDVWEWDGTTWIPRQTNRLPGTPPSPESFAMAFDPARREITMLAEDGLWHFGPVHPAEARSFGVGCQGGLGVPLIDAEPPWLGYAVEIISGPIPAGASSFLLMGRSASTWGAFVLPLDLTAVGMPGCTLFVRPEVVTTMTVASSAATWSGMVPSDPGLLGASLFAQTIALSGGGGNALGAALSNAAELVIGAK